MRRPRSHHPFAAVCPFESKKQLAASLRRRPYSSFDVLYLCRPKKSNLARIIDDYRVAVDESPPDLWERFLSQFFPCVFGGIPVLEVRFCWVSCCSSLKFQISPSIHAPARARNVRRCAAVDTLWATTTTRSTKLAAGP